MKAVASSNISQYENAVRALDDYYQTVQLGLAACFQQQDQPLNNMAIARQNNQTSIGAIVFGSDQGLVGQFNEEMVKFISDTLLHLPGTKTVWTVGERLHSRLEEAGLATRVYITNFDEYNIFVDWKNFS